jgi:tetratricopeptide (TPR) repeat protein
MNISSKKEWLVRTKSREILGPFTQAELIEQLNRNTFSIQDEICGDSGLWVSAKILSSREQDEITRTSSRANTNSIELTKSDLTPTPTHTEKILSFEEKKSNAKTPPFQRPLFNESSSGSKFGEAPLQSNPQSPPQKAGLNSTAKYPLLTAVVLTVVTILVFFRPQATTRETSEANSSKGALSRKEDSAVVKQAKNLIKLGKNKQALKVLANYHESHPKSDTSYLSLYAALLITEGESVLRAKRLLEQIIANPENTPEKAEAHLWLGYLLLSEDEGDMGESHFLETLQLNPKDPMARFNLGRAYLKQDKYQQALDYLQLAELELPSFWLIQVHKGWAKHSIGLNTDASLAFKSAVNEAKDRWVNYIYQSIFYLKIKDTEAARETLFKMLGRDPDFEKLSPLPLGFYQSRSNYEEYLSAFSQVMEKAPEEEKNIGKIYLTYLGNPLSRGEDWRKMDAIANHSDNLLPRILSLKMMLPHAVDSGYLKAVINKLPPNLDFFGPYAYVLRGQAREKLNQISEAQLDYQKALGLDPQCAVAMWYQYDLFRKLHRGPEARETLKNLITAHPNYIPALEQSANF